MITQHCASIYFMHTLFDGITLAEDFFCHVLLVTLSIGQKVINATDHSPPTATDNTQSCLSSDSVPTQSKLNIWELVFQLYCTWNEIAKAVIFGTGTPEHCIMFNSPPTINERRRTPYRTACECQFQLIIQFSNSRETWCEVRTVGAKP